MVSLKRLRLDNNEIVCNCNILWLLKLLKQSTHIEAEIICKHPANLLGKALSDLNDVDLNCSKCKMNGRNGRFRCNVSIYSPHIEIPEIIEEPHDVSVNVGETVSFKCRASGDPVPDIVWMQNSLKVSVDNPRYHLLEDGTLRIENVNYDLAGEYECMAQNVIGETKSRPVRMAINYQSNSLPRINDIYNRPKKPKIILKPIDLTVSPGDNIVLHCTATG